MSSAVGKKDEAHASGGRLVFAGSGRLCGAKATLCLKRGLLHLHNNFKNKFVILAK